MLKKLTFIISLSILLLVVSCRSARNLKNTSGMPSPSISVVSTGNAELDYLNTYRDIAISEMKRTGIPASITLAQGMIESNYGRSELARRGNNHFGIKCHNWNGPSVYHDDDKKNDCFRKYNNPEESFRDHSDFLTNGTRYSSLFSLPRDDYKAWARGLKKAGYATNPDYANMLISKIEEANLSVYDKGYKGEIKELKSTPQNSSGNNLNVTTASISDDFVIPGHARVMVNNRIEYIIVKDGDTREKIEQQNNLLRWELARYNELSNDFSPVPGQILYLQPKRDKAEAGKDNYIAKAGDTMYIISQKFGIKLKSLYEMNRMEEGAEPAAGTKLWLRSIKPVN